MTTQPETAHRPTTSAGGARGSIFLRDGPPTPGRTTIITHAGRMASGAYGDDDRSSGAIIDCGPKAGARRVSCGPVRARAVVVIVADKNDTFYVIRSDDTRIPSALFVVMTARATVSYVNRIAACGTGEYF